jgi:hypothetical protein
MTMTVMSTDCHNPERGPTADHRPAARADAKERRTPHLARKEPDLRPRLLARRLHVSPGTFHRGCIRSLQGLPASSTRRTVTPMAPNAPVRVAGARPKSSRCPRPLRYTRHLHQRWAIAAVTLRHGWPPYAAWATQPRRGGAILNVRKSYICVNQLPDGRAL